MPLHNSQTSSDPHFLILIFHIPPLCLPLRGLSMGKPPPTCTCTTFISHPHRLANQEVLRWQLAMQKEVGDNVTHDQIKEYLWKTLRSGQVVPGCVHCPVFLGKCLELSSDTATGSFEIPILDSWLYRSSVIHDLSSTPALLFN